MKSIYALIIASILLSACGSRPDENATTGDSTTFPDLGQALGDLTVRAYSDTTSLQTGGTDVATITALVTNAQNQAVANETVEFSSTGGVLQSPDPTTDENGEATASLKLAGDFRKQPITVTITSGSATQQVLINAIGTGFAIEGPDAVVLNDSFNLTATLTAGNQEPIINQLVRFTSAAGNTITPTTAVTNADGVVEATVISIAGSDTISLSALDNTVLGEHTFSVSSDIISFLSPANGTEFDVGSIYEVQVEWMSNNLPVVGKALSFSSTAGQIAGSNQVTTDANGRATIRVSSSSAGPAVITVEPANSSGPEPELSVEFIATAPDSVKVATSSSRIATEDTGEITATVFDPNGNPVKNMEVIFSSADLKGGQLNLASATTDSAGEASVIFTAGKLATEFDEISISAEVSGTNISDDTRLTVYQRVLNITMGTSQLISEKAGGVQYALPFAVQVADGGGRALQNAQVEISIEPISYAKGQYIIFTAADGSKVWQQVVVESCDSEDANRNRVLDEGEDINNNDTLDPQDPTIVAQHSTETPTVENGVITTDANGSGYFEIVYPASSANWSTVVITARAKALGVEAEETFPLTPPVLASRVKSVDTGSPPNINSPYGTQAGCENGD